MWRKISPGCLTMLLACGGDDLGNSTGSGGTDTTSDSVGTTGTASSTGSSSSATASTGESTSGSTSGSTSTSTSAGSTGTTGGTGGTGTTGGAVNEDCLAYESFVADLGAAADDTERWALVDAFWREITYGTHGFPVRCDDRLVFVLTDDVGGTLTVAGDFNAWDPSALPLSQPVAGFPLHVYELAGPPAPGLYKFVRNAADYFADPWARRFGWDEFGEYSLTGARPDASHHERYPGFSENLGGLQPRTVTVYVPAGGMDGPDLPVLYMQDGNNLFDPGAFFGGWKVTETADTLIGNNSIRDLFIVGIDNTPARMDEYTHTQDLFNNNLVGGQGDTYADFVALGVKPFIDARYPTLTGPADTAVAGSSLGGLISLHILRRHPTVFGYGASMSGTLGWGKMGAQNPTMEELYGQDAPTGSVIYLDSGGSGQCPGSNDNYCPTVSMRDALQGLGWTLNTDLFYVFEAGAGHNEVAWAGRLPGMLTTWFPGQ